MLHRRLCLVLSFVVLGSFSRALAEEENPIVTLVKSKVTDKSKPFGMTVQFKVKQGEAKAFEEAFAPCLAATRKEPGCIVYFLNKDLDDANTFVVYERFKSVAALEAHAKSAHVADVLKKITPLLDGDPIAKVYSIAGE
jgi:quinol monooxygenase YgiN